MLTHCKNDYTVTVRILVNPFTHLHLYLELLSLFLYRYFSFFVPVFFYPSLTYFIYNVISLLSFYFTLLTSFYLSVFLSLLTFCSLSLSFTLYYSLSLLLYNSPSHSNFPIFPLPLSLSLFYPPLTLSPYISLISPLSSFSFLFLSSLKTFLFHPFKRTKKVSQIQ